MKITETGILQLWIRKAFLKLPWKIKKIEGRKRNMKDRKRSWSKPQSKKRTVSKRIETFSSAFPIGVGPQSNQIFDIERVFIEIFWLIHIEEIKGRN